MITQEEDKIMDRSMLFYYLKRWMETNKEALAQDEDFIEWLLSTGKTELEQLTERAITEVMGKTE